MLNGFTDSSNTLDTPAVSGRRVSDAIACEDHRCAQMTPAEWRAASREPDFASRFRFKTVARHVACVVRAKGMSDEPNLTVVDPVIAPRRCAGWRPPRSSPCRASLLSQKLA